MLGSPPLARGTGYYIAAPSNRPRITPACAGNSKSYHCFIVIARDHPRLRGEQISIAYKSCCIVGSPPLARGTVVIKRHVRVQNGITPACAGNSTTPEESDLQTGDHPRLRGEQAIVMRQLKLILGSPPLARGTDKYDVRVVIEAGITPACAGNSK